MRRTFLFLWTCAVLMATATFSWSEELKILTEDLPPLNFVENGNLVGPSVEIVREIQRRVGSIDPIHVYPWARAYKIALEKKNIVLFGTTQTEQRQDLFKWVGPLAVKRDVLIARKGSTISIHSLEDAKKVKRIGTLRDDTRQYFLSERGFSNLDPVSDDKQNAQKLALGRIDLWAYKVPGMVTVCRLAGVDSEEFVEVLHLRQVEVSIAFSSQTPDAIVARWNDAFLAMIEDGTIQEIRSRWNPEK